MERMKSRPKTDENNGGKSNEEGSGVKDHDGEDNDEDYREVPWNISADEVFFTKATRLSSSMSKKLDPKKIMVLVSNGT